MFIHVPVQGCCLGGRVGSMLWVGELATPWRRGLCLRPPRCVSTGPVVCVLPGWQMNVNVNVTPARRRVHTRGNFRVSLSLS